MSHDSLSAAIGRVRLCGAAKGTGGTGFVTAGSRLVVTCAHVVDGPGPYEFVPDATRRPIAVSVAAKTGPDLDLAVLQPTEPLPPEVLGL